MSNQSLIGLNWLNFCVAVMEAAFGAFLAVYLTARLWSQTDIGLALSVSTVAAMIFQVPAGMLVDAMPSKKLAAGIAITGITIAALIISVRPQTWPVLTAEAMQGIASCLLTPAVAAITLALTHQDTLGERLGNNTRFAAIGSLAAAALMGAVGAWLSHRAVFYLSAGAGLAALFAVWSIRTGDFVDAPRRTAHPAALPPRHAKAKLDPKRDLLCDRRLLVFAGCFVLFQLGNAAILPLAAGVVTRAGGQTVELVVAAAIIVPQALAAMISPTFGRAAQSWGRRPVLVLGFAAMPLRALLLATDGRPDLMIAYQAVDAISAAVFGVMVPLVVADITHRGGRFNMAMGVVGLAVGVGATLSTTLAGAIADRFGSQAAFLALAGVGVAATVLMWWLMPETAHLPAQHKPAPVSEHVAG